MLVLSRYRGEKTILTLEDGRRIEMEVVKVIGDKVRLGWTADKTIRIDREEIDAARQRENGGAN